MRWSENEGKDIMIGVSSMNNILSMIKKINI